MDADFHALLSVSGSAGPLVVRIRIDSLRAAELATLILDVIRRCDTDLLHGALVSVGPAYIRWRRLLLV